MVYWSNKYSDGGMQNTGVLLIRRLKMEAAY